ncbi:hypothetical protein EX30DRAFT_341780 [Ascodesmis nigricans]|uniref:Uncharacterized protein n=1 Tax=Ascodesmis nigricans TaxID=341454 RepID=A0A4S2MUF9_9PEZI|nr:hypothetical protein EX30DRAFT_341780 [Ascodesmis nigricans]
MHLSWITTKLPALLLLTPLSLAIHHVPLLGLRRPQLEKLESSGVRKVVDEYAPYGVMGARYCCVVMEWCQ